MMTMHQPIIQITPGKHVMREVEVERPRNANHRELEQHEPEPARE